MIDHSVNIDGVYKTEFRMPFHDFAQNNEKLHCYLFVHGVIVGVKHVFKHVGEPHFSAEKIQIISNQGLLIFSIIFIFFLLMIIFEKLDLNQ